jgi:hypothetical protein
VNADTSGSNQTGLVFFVVLVVLVVATAHAAPENSFPETIMPTVFVLLEFMGLPFVLPALVIRRFFQESIAGWF